MTGGGGEQWIDPHIESWGSGSNVKPSLVRDINLNDLCARFARIRSIDSLKRQKGRMILRLPWQNCKLEKLCIQTLRKTNYHVYTHGLVAGATGFVHSCEIPH